MERPALNFAEQMAPPPWIRSDVFENAVERSMMASSGSSACSVALQPDILSLVAAAAAELLTLQTFCHS